MSMPSVPDLDITREDSLNTLLMSIGMEELSLAHLLNAEGEKIQMVLGTLPGCHGHFSLEDILRVNTNARQMIRDMMMTQMLLTVKLESVVELSEQDYCPFSHTCNRDRPSPRDGDRDCNGKT
ncbi:MAG: hypothetical protein RSF90_06495 [Pygmaiobacter sp.]